LAANAQAVLPVVDLIEESMMAIDDLVENAAVVKDLP